MKKKTDENLEETPDSSINHLESSDKLENLEETQLFFKI